MKKIILFLLAGTVLYVGCATNTSVAGAYTNKTECLGVELDGSQTVKAWGTGKDEVDAMEQALKNAVSDVIFNGITDGKSDCDSKPIVPEVNAQKKYETFFNGFFSDKGAYKKYVSIEDGRKNKQILKDQKSGRNTVTIGVSVRIQRVALKESLVKEGIIK